MKKTLFIKNAAILTATSIILKILGIIFKVWLASKIGSEGIGLYHLVFSFYILISAFATSGLPTAVTRLISERLAVNNQKGALSVVKRALIICLLLSLISFLAVFFFADFISVKLLGDIRALPSLKILCFSPFFMAFSGVFKSYFFAKRNVTVNSFAILCEQFVRILLCFLFVNQFSNNSVASACFFVILADTVSEAVSLFIVFCFFLKEKRTKDFTLGCSLGNETKEIVRISSPILLSRYSTSVLRTAENLLVPKTLSKTLSYSTALSRFGAVRGMALPVLFFPSSVLAALSALLLPEISEAVAQNRPFIIKNAVRKTLSTTWLLGVIFGAVFFFCGEKLGALIYNDTVSGTLIKILSPIVPLMYLDSMCDGILKGLDKQTYTFFTALSDSLLRIVFILIFVPKYSMSAFLIIMILSNVFTCVLHVGKLINLTKITIKPFKDLISPVLASFFICYICQNLLSFVSNSLFYCVLFGFTVCLLYVLFLLGFKIIDIHDYI